MCNGSIYSVNTKTNYPDGFIVLSSWPELKQFIVFSIVYPISDLSNFCGKLVNRYFLIGNRYINRYGRFDIWSWNN